MNSTQDTLSSHRHTALTGLGIPLSLLLIVASSVSGALVFRLALFGPDTGIVTVDRRILLTLMVGALLSLWAALFALLIRRVNSYSWERALYWTAVCQTPMLIGLAVVSACLSSNVAWRGFSSSETGRLLLQPMIADLLIGATAAAQLLLLGLLKRRLLLLHLPIIGILLVGLALRVSHLGWGLPGLLHPDEHRYLGPAIIMAARGDLNPHYFQNPSLMIYLSYLVLLVMAPQSRAFLTAGSFFSLGVPNPRGDFLDMLAIRGIEAVAGTLTILAVYLAARELLDRRAALMSALLLAVSFLHVRNSHYATNDILATALMAFSFYFAARIYTRGRASDYLLAGLLGGLATSAKYNVGLFAAAIVVAHLARFVHTGLSAYPWHRHLLLPAAGILSILAFLAGTPYAILDYPSFAADFSSQFGYGADVWNGQQSQPTSMLFLS
ncbi:MAG TPA: glycosyltransferase family 39 protein, partial [Chloroflexota bacterium]|nr:glycosyltransferase family 39 protein [Chloroflexota bacterium]